MISRVSIIGTLKDGSTKTACISIKGRRTTYRDAKTLSERQLKYIVPFKDEFISLKIISELQTCKKGKTYRVASNVEKWENLTEDVLSMLYVADYELMACIYDGIIPSIW